MTELGGEVRGDVVELTKAGFGLPESPRLWYLEYKETIEEIGLRWFRGCFGPSTRMADYGPWRRSTGMTPAMPVTFLVRPCGTSCVGG